MRIFICKYFALKLLLNKTFGIRVCHAELVETFLAGFQIYFKLKIANRYPSIPNPDNTASVFAAVTDFCRNSSRL